MSVFKAYDIRGVYPEEINRDLFKKIGQTAALLFKRGPVVLAFDTRHGSEVLAESVKAGLKKQSKNIKIYEIGLSTTPMFYFFVNKFKASGGVMITASHNPAEYNGAKIVGRKASMISGKDIENFMKKNEEKIFN